MKKYDLIVFDWDGTIIDSVDFAIESIQKAASDLGYPGATKSQIAEYFGLPLATIHKALFSKPSLEDFTKKFFSYYTEELLATHFFPGAIETLNFLKQSGFELAIATNKPKAKLFFALEKANIKSLFTAIRTPEDGYAKPDPRMLIELLKEIDADPSTALMVGDTTFDMEIARGANVDAVAACYGHHPKEKLAEYNPVVFINDIRELQKILKK